MNSKIRRPNHLLLTALFFAVIPTTNAQDFIETFKTPPSRFRPIPFWHLNGQLTKAKIETQIDDAGRSGFGGVAVLPVTARPQHPTGLPAPGMSPEYLSSEYFNRYHDILNAAKKRNLKVILYDDVDFPSGSAGGKLAKEFPDAIRKVINKKDTLLNWPGNANYKLPYGKLMAITAIEQKSNQRLELSAHVKSGMLNWKLPKGSWKISAFVLSNAKGQLVDYMDPTAVKKFVGLTYDEYAKRFSSYFGNTIEQTFFDDVGYVTEERGWTGKFNEIFKKRYGRDPRPLYPALWEDIGPDTKAARAALFDTRSELLAEGFPKIITEWTHKYGLKSSGHPPGNYEIQPVDMNFDVFKFYRYQDIPTMDAIFYRGHGREGYKLVSSAASFYDKPIVSSETYGAFAEKEFNTKMLYQTAMEIFSRGINFLIPHGMWLDYRPEAVRIPPLVSPYSDKVGEELPMYNDFAARTSMMLTGGRRIAEIGILYPIASLQGFYHFDAKDNRSVGKYVAKGTDYLEVGNILTTKVHQDFTFIHPEMLTGKNYSLRGNKIHLNNLNDFQDYKIMILPAGEVISLAALGKIYQFYLAGGKVVATGSLPYQSTEFGRNAGVKAIIDRMFIRKNEFGAVASLAINTNRNKGACIFVADTDLAKLGAVIDNLNPQPEIKFGKVDVLQDTDKKQEGEVSYIQKIKDNNNIVYIINSNDVAISTFVDIKGVIKPELWNPHTGEKLEKTVYTHISINGQDYTRVQVDLPAVKSIFIISRIR